MITQGRDVAEAGHTDLFRSTHPMLPEGGEGPEGHDIGHGEDTDRPGTVPRHQAESFVHGTVPAVAVERAVHHPQRLNPMPSQPFLEPCTPF